MAKYLDTVTVTVTVTVTITVTVPVTMMTNLPATPQVGVAESGVLLSLASHFDSLEAGRSLAKMEMRRVKVSSAMARSIRGLAMAEAWKSGLC